MYARAHAQGLSIALIEQGVVIYFVYAGRVAAVVAAVVAGVFRVAMRGRKPKPLTTTAPN